MHARRLITATLTAAAVIVLTPALATPATWWDGQWNPNVRLDNSQVEVRTLAPALDTSGDSDCWDEWSCQRTEHGLPPEYVGAEWLDAPMVDADGGTHDPCVMIVADTSLIVCDDGYSETS